VSPTRELKRGNLGTPGRREGERRGKEREKSGEKGEESVCRAKLASPLNDVSPQYTILAIAYLLPV
jgi:hypothetical protein